VVRGGRVSLADEDSSASYRTAESDISAFSCLFIEISHLTFLVNYSTTLSIRLDLANLFLPSFPSTLLYRPSPISANYALPAVPTSVFRSSPFKH
jgi:hypothetical protein